MAVYDGAAWQDRILNAYPPASDGERYYKIVAVDGTVVQEAVKLQLLNTVLPGNEGTPVNAGNLNKVLAAMGTAVAGSVSYILAMKGFSLFDGAKVRVKFPGGAPSMLNINAAGAKPVRGSIVPNNWMELIYDATIDAFLPVASQDTAAEHNKTFKGRSLGTSVTAAQWAAISSGSFDDLYIGDYWTINSINYRIAAFDYYMGLGDIPCTKHHVVIVPDESLGTAQMNSSSDNSTGYGGSAMRTTNLTAAKNTINAAFSTAHILKHRRFFVNATSSGKPTAGAWFDSTVDLMDATMLLGAGIMYPISTYGNYDAGYHVEKEQLPLFALRPEFIKRTYNFWIADTLYGAGLFAYFYVGGILDYYGANISLDVRPAFCLS